MALVSSYNLNNRRLVPSDNPHGLSRAETSSNLQSESIQHFASPQTREGQGPTVEILDYPFSFHRDVQKSCPQRAADVRPPLTPIQACAREPAAQGSSCLEVDAKGLKCLRSLSGDVVCAGSSLRTARKPPQGLEAIVKQHPRGARHVIIASPCSAQSAWRAWHERVARAAGEDAQRFKRTGHVWPFETVEAMLPLDLYSDQLVCLQSIQVRARG